MIIYKFCPDPLLTTAKRSSIKLPIELVGVLPMKTDKESFWVSPSHLSTENNLQGQLYDQICEENILKTQDLKERAYTFMGQFD